MLTLEQIKDRLDDRVIAAVAARTGIHRNTLDRIKSGANKNPTYHILSRLSDYLEENK
jgi:transcriptional regulator with XRE-family HTH domain